MVVGPKGTGVAEALGAGGVPRVDAAHQAGPGRGDLVPAGRDVAVELGLPQLVLQPPRQVGDAARVDPAVAEPRPAAGDDPGAGAALAREGPGVAAERADAAGLQELVGPHGSPFPVVRARNAPTSASNVAGGGSAGAGSAATTTRAVVSIWSR